MRRITTLLRNLFRRDQVEQELSEELQSSIDLLADEQMARGVPEAEATRRARMELGGAEAVKEAVREVRMGARMEQIWRDAAYGIRVLRRTPGFTVISILTLALGIGANTAIFSVFDRVLLRPLPYPEPHRLFAIEETDTKLIHAAATLPVNAMHFLEWRKSAQSFQAIALVDDLVVNLTSAGEPMRVRAGRVSASLFPMLGVRTQLGRTFLESEDKAGHDRVVVLSDGLWRKRFEASTAVLGKKVVLDGIPYEVIGVLAGDAWVPNPDQLFTMPVSAGAAELWKPMAIRDDELTPMGDFNYGCIGRLKPGVTREQAFAELDALQNSFAKTTTGEGGLSARLVDLREQITGRSRNSILLLLAAVGAVFLMVCANIANLLLTRATGRQRELAIRTAIGASTRRVLQQMMTESLVLSFSGGCLGVLVAYAALRGIVATAPVEIPRLSSAGLDAGALLFAFGLSAVTGVVFTIVPALRFTRLDSFSALKAGGRTSTEDRGRGTLRTILIGVEVALAAMCLATTGLLLNSFVRLMHVDKGFEVQRILTLDVNLPQVRYANRAARTQFLRTAIDRLKNVPGVLEAGVSNRLPLGGEGSNNIILLEGETDFPRDRPIVDFRCVSPGYLRVMGVPVIAGRMLEESDRGRSVAVVSAQMAKRLWPGANPIGKRFHVGGTNWPLEETIGVVADVREVSLQKQPNLTVYIPYWERDRADMSMAIRTAMDPRGVAAAVRGELRRMDPELPLQRFRTMEQIVDASVAERRFQLDLLLMFAGAAIFLASLGIYGVVSYSVAQRTNEMGIRIALGATAGSVRRLVLHRAMEPVLAGATAGLALGRAVGRLLRGVLFGVSASDPVTFGAVAAVLVLIAAAACYFPARRATRVDPVVALRWE